MLRAYWCTGSPTASEATASVTSQACCREQLGAVEPARVAAPVGHDDAALPAGRRLRGRPRRRSSAPVEAARRRRTDGRRWPPRPRPVSARARRRRRRQPPSAQLDPRRRAAGGMSRRTCGELAPAGAGPASAIWPPMRPCARAAPPRARRPPRRRPRRAPRGRRPRRRGAARRPARRGERQLAAGARVLGAARAASRRGSGRCRRCSRGSAAPRRPGPGAACRQRGVGDQRAVHADRVGAALGEQPLRRVGVDDARGDPSGGPRRNGAVSSPMRLSGAGGGGTMPTQPMKVDESPTAT